MAGRNLRALLAHAVATAGYDSAGVPDRELLRRYRDDRDEPAFAELVRRYARLVWAVCRQQLPTDADAEDAFQATFLALARNPGAVRDGNRLGPFLHGVAVRVGSNARRSASRRARREHVAGRVGPGPAVPDSAWDAALAAVHAEAAQLPEALRVPFVLCCLEGKGTTEAADLLGWKLGTLSGRLTRAKQTLLTRLEERGLSAGAVVVATAAGGATAGVPVGVVARAIEITRPGVAVAESVLTLSQGVVGMTAFRMKLVAAAVLVAGGLTTSVGSSWLAKADAQTPDVVKDVQLLLTDVAKPVPMKVVAKFPPKWEYDFVLASDMTPSKFVEFLREREAEGWEFNAEATLNHHGAAAPHWVFRRPAQPGKEDAAALAVKEIEQLTTKLMVFDAAGTAEGGAKLFFHETVPDNPAAIAAEIKRLQDRLAKLKAGEFGRVFIEEELPLGPAEMGDILRRLAAKQLGNKQPDVIVGPDHRSITIRGSKEAVEWAAGIVNKLNGK